MKRDRQYVDWHLLSVEAVLLRLRTRSIGLSAAEAAQRLTRDGPNQLQDRQRGSAWTTLGRQFGSVMIWILIAAAVISGVVGDAVDAAVIAVIALLNVAVGFWQEFKAERSIAALRKLTSPQAKVMRDGVPVSVPAAEVVAGDLLLLEAGDLVVADARVIACASLACIEAALTGETEAVDKQVDALGETELPLGDRSNLVFMGTSVAAGTGRALVVATAMASELGQIAALIGHVDGDQDTPLQQKLDAFGQVLIWAAMAVVALLFVLGWWRGSPLDELLLGSISLAVAAVPEGLPAIVTVALSMGVMRMARHRTLVRKLAAVETLGSVTVICTDKTGTLTVGEMTARALHVGGRRFAVSGEGYGPEGSIADPDRPSLLALGTVLVACNNTHRSLVDGRWTLLGDPTEGALLVAGIKAGCDRDMLDRSMPLLHSFPFDSTRKRSSVVRRSLDGSLTVYANGAPGPLLDACTRIRGVDGSSRPITDADRTEIHDAISDMASEALRVLGSARRALPAGFDGFTAKAVERELTFVGLTGLLDPPRPEARAAIASCRAAGIRVVMITGDHPQTAAAIAADLGIVSATDGHAMTGITIDALSDQDLRRQARETAVYARVSAAHKLRIIHALKADGAVVAMTGDGVNDAPAIKGADIGIAMGRSGTEVTRQAADMIITDDNFATIVTAVEAGRGIYDNIRKTLQYLLAGNTAELLLMLVCVLAGLPAPLLPIHLLWINLVTDGGPALCLATDPVDDDVMRRPPRSRLEAVTARGFLPVMLLTGVLTGALALAAYLYMLDHASVEVARSYAFTVLVFAELLRAFGARSETLPVWRISLASNKPLVAVIGLSIAFQFASQHVPAIGSVLKTTAIPYADGFALLALALIPLLALEIVKFVRRAVRHAR